MVITAYDTKLKPGYKQTEVGLIPEDWEAKTFGEVMTGFTSGVTPSRKQPDFYKGNIRWITSGELNYNVIMDTIEKISIEAVSKTNLKLLPSGTFLIAITGMEAEGTRGSCGIVGAEATTNQHCMALFPTKQLSTHYLFHYYVYKGKSLALEYCQGTKQQDYTSKIVKLLPILLPPLPEQIAIAGVLSDLDSLITSLDKLIAKKRDIKQATMQQLLTGKARLSGFSGEWEVKKLGEIFQFLSTANNSRSDLSEYGEIKYIHYGDIHMKWRSFLDCSSDELPLIQGDKVRNVSFLEDGDLVMADASEDTEGLGISVEVKHATGRKVVAGLHTFLLRGDKEVLADGFKGYLQYIPAVKDSLKKAATGISVYGISKNNVRNISIYLPDITEQRAIAAILSNMDAEITALEQKRDKTRALKQGMMQELLTGKTRLV